MSNRRFKRMRVGTPPPVLDSETLYCLAHGHTLLAGLPIGLVELHGTDTLPGPAAAIVKREGITEVRRLCELEGIVNPGEPLWCEALGKRRGK